MTELVKGWDAPLIEAIADAEGRIVTTSHPHCASSLAACLKSLRALPDWSAGDVGVTNDVYYGSSHPTEITAATPQMDGARIVSWALLRSDLPDVGGWELGSYSPRALDIWSEGGRIVPAKAYLRGQPRREVLELLELNSRTPKLNCAIVNALCRSAIARQKSATPLGEPTAPSINGSREGRAQLEGPLILRVEIKQHGQRLGITFPDLPPPSEKPLNATRAITLDAVASGIAIALGLDTAAATALHRQIDLAIEDDTLLSATRRRPAGWARAITGAALFRAVCEALGAHNAKRPERDPYFNRSTGSVTESRKKLIQSLEQGL